MNKFPFSVLSVSLCAIASWGCQTTEQQLREQQRQQWEGKVSQQSMALEDRIQQLENRVENLRLRLESLESRDTELENGLRVLSDKMNQNASSLRSEIQGFNSTMDKKIGIILDEVVKENERLLQKLRGSKKTGAMQGYEHVVKSGETLSTIARQYNTSVQAIIEANEITDPNNLRVGQKLFIPQ